MDNRKQFDAGIKKIREITSGYIYDYLVKGCEDLVNDAVRGVRGWKNFTGNTVTSYACGLYVDGALSYYYCSGDSMPQPIRVKLTKGEAVYLSPDYDGRNRGLRGSIQTDGGFGKDTSLSFLKSYNPKVNKGFAIVMCVGTEYAVYLENRANANVLRDTFQRAPGILMSNLKPMT